MTTSRQHDKAVAAARRGRHGYASKSPRQRGEAATDAKMVVGDLRNGEVLLLENLHFYSEEEQNDLGFAQKLTDNVDLYVNDALSTTHEAHASTEGVTKFIKPSVAGVLLAKDLSFEVGAISEPQRPFVAIVGGPNLSSKLAVLEALLNKCDTVLLGGSLVYTFFSAQGLSIGSSLAKSGQDELVTSFEQNAKQKGVGVLLPSAMVVATAFDTNAESRVVFASNIPDWMGMDIGTAAIKMYINALRGVKTILWTGPMGIHKMPKFAQGSYVGEMIAKGVTTIIADDECVALAEAALVKDKISHISTGGGVSLELLEGKELPWLVVIENV